MSYHTDDVPTKNSASDLRNKLELRRLQRQQQQNRETIDPPPERSMSRSSSEKCNICSECMENIKCNQTTGCVSGCVAGAAIGSTCGLGTPTACLCGICGAAIGGDADGESFCRSSGGNRKTKRKGKKRKTRKYKRKKTRSKKTRRKKKKNRRKKSRKGKKRRRKNKK